jgi:hypothetical protein
MQRFTVRVYPDKGGYSVPVPVLGVATRGETIGKRSLWRATSSKSPCRA